MNLTLKIFLVIFLLIITIILLNTIKRKNISMKVYPTASPLTVFRAETKFVPTDALAWAPVLQHASSMLLE